eukprot:CAMPEP_0119332244 /NCGR_PEP_ID=MMETSP1333-20130426/82349_1 /TAXON_ID=418940 /ORGANISM="Scyphosphaera apsteinii, Strain RCC1455" /LENGTH=344 /DNA_ID=CAMNT_0007342031 /DNA_START=105 /DNA_END=1139 /DNA_ORIENTATION=-
MSSRRKVNPDAIGSTATVDRDAIAVDASEFETLASLIATARESLRPLAKTDRIPFYSRAFDNLGDTNGISVHLRVASVDLNRDGSLSGAEYARFLSDAALMIDNLQASVTSSSVTTALLLTIAVSLLVIDVNPPFDNDQDGWFGPVSSGHATSGDTDATRMVSHGFYCIELALLTITMMACFAGLFLSVVLHNIVLGMPSHLAAITFALHHARAYTFINASWYVGVFSLMFAVCFTTARYSMITFFATFIGSVVVTASLASLLWPIMQWTARSYIVQAKAIIAAHDADRATGRTLSTKQHGISEQKADAPMDYAQGTVGDASDELTSIRDRAAFKADSFAAMGA